jgi:uncharacterized membrane protein
MWAMGRNGDCACYAIGAKPDATGEIMANSTITDHIAQNIEAVVALQRREWDTVPPAQRRLERISRLVARPLYLVGILGFVLVWMGANEVISLAGGTPFDPLPYQLLEFLLSLVSLITMTVVLIAQNRQTRLEQQWAHLDLQVNLLTEQKVTKLIHLLEELRRDLPIVEDRHDAQAAALQQPATTADVVSALEKGGITPEEPESR